jgi:L-asparaginase
VKGIVLSTFGSGNGPNNPIMIEMIGQFINDGGLVLNITQCYSGAVQLGKYDSSKQFLNVGVLGGGTLTTEAAMTKMMFVLANYKNDTRIRELLTTSLCGEM